MWDTHNRRRQRPRKSWEKRGRGKREPTWCTPWGVNWRQLLASLARPESTIATLLRTEVIGLNAFLARVGVPGVSPNCLCGAQSETPKHVVIFCPNRATRRAEMLMEVGTPHYGELLTTEEGLAAVSGWFLRHGGLTQFAWAKAEADRPEGGECWGELESLR